MPLTQKANANIKSFARFKSRKLKEVGRVVDQVNPTQDLCAIHTAADLRPPQVDALEAVPICAASFNLQLEPVRFLNDRQRSFDIDLVTSQLPQGCLSFLHPTLSHKPPRTLRHKKDTRNDDCNPKPLQRKGQRVCPVIVERLRPGSDAVGQELPYNKAQIHKTSEMSSQCHGTYLGRISRGNDNVASQDQTPKQFTHQQYLKAPRKELNEHQGARQCYAGRKSPLAPKEIHRICCKQCADDLTHRITHRQTGLPRRGNDVFALKQIAKVATELGRGVQIAEQLRVKGEHNHTEGDKGRPADGRRIELACFREGEVVLGADRKGCSGCFSDGGLGEVIVACCGRLGEGGGSHGVVSDGVVLLLYLPSPSSP